MTRAAFSGVCLFLVGDQKDIEQFRPLRERLNRVPVLLAGVAVGPPSSLLRSTGAVFHRFFAPPPPEGTEGTPSAEPAGEPEALNSLLKREHGPVLAAFLHDDREAAAAHWALACKRMRIPVYLLQRETALPPDAFGIAGGAGAAARWGHTRPTRILVQSPELALALGRAAAGLGPDDFGVNGLEEVLLGQTAFAAPWDLPPGPMAVPGLVLAEEGILTPAQQARLGELAVAWEASLLPFDPAVPAPALPGAARRLLLTRSAALGMAALRQGWRALVIDPAGLGLEAAAAPIAVCATAERGLRLLPGLWRQPPQPDWPAPARLRAKASAVMQADVVAQEITDRVLRAAARAKLPVAIPGAAPPRGLRRFEAMTHLRFPLFPFAELRAAIDAVALPPVPRVVVVTHDWSDRTGLARPAKYYLTALNALGLEAIALEVGEAARAADILGELRIDDFVVFNSIGVFERSDAAVEVLAELAPSGRCLYLHETAFTLERFAEQQPARFARLAPWLREASVLCVSRKQAAFLREAHGVRQTHVVYNTTTLPEAGGGTAAAPDRPVVAMVGTVQRRKGADLFSAVAELAARAGHDWAFEWIGHETEEAASLYRSAEVAWRGRLEGRALAEAMQRVDTLFLSSRDDPFPLSALEAIRLGKRVVCYAATGIEEVIRGLPGTAVFDDYTPEAALAALVAARREQPSPAANAALEAEVFGLPAFLNRMTAAIAATLGRQPATAVAPVLPQAPPHTLAAAAE